MELAFLFKFYFEVPQCTVTEYLILPCRVPKPLMSGYWANSTVCIVWMRGVIITLVEIEAMKEIHYKEVNTHQKIMGFG